MNYYINVWIISLFIKLFYMLSNTFVRIENE